MTVSLAAGDRGAIIIFIAYAWVTITALAGAIRLWLAWSNSLRWRKDDLAFVLGVTFAIGSSVCFHAAGKHGLGQNISRLSSNDIEVYYKSIYGGELVGIAAQWLGKLSFLQLSQLLAPRATRSYNIIFSIVTFWGVFSFLAIALQCGPKEPWIYAPNACPTKGSFYFPVIIMNIFTDILLSAWILPKLWRLLLDAEWRFLFIILFGSRLVVASFASAQLISVSRHIHQQDVTYESFGRILWTLCVIHLSVLQATIPRTKRFVAALDSQTHPDHLLPEFELHTTMSNKKTLVTAEVAPVTEPGPALLRSTSCARSRSSMRSEQPLVPLQLTPSFELTFRTEIVAAPNSQSHASRSRSAKKKREAHTWKKLLRYGERKSDSRSSSLFQWSRPGSFARERIVQTRTVVQEVEVVSPRESRWTFRVGSPGMKSRLNSVEQQV